MSEVIAKFRCESVTNRMSGGEIHLNPVVSGSEENDKFFKYTPYGELRLGTINDSTLGLFSPGAEYTVTIRKATK